MKQCQKCKERKDRKEFHKKKSASDGLRSYCKICHCAEVRAYNARYRKPSRYEKTHRENNGQQEKRCNKCGQWKLLDSFTISRGAKTCKDGRVPRCKVCRPSTRNIPIPNKKQCTMCGRIKPKCEFSISKRDGLFPSCKRCRNQHNRKYYRANKEVLSEKFKQYYYSHKEKYARSARDSEDLKRWAKNDRIRRTTSPARTLHHRMSTAIYLALKDKKNGRSWESLVGYNTSDLIKHIEAQFRDGMSWGNMGEWHIDHIIPKAFFKFESENDTEFRMCWRLENLQPMWAKDNMAKHKTVPDFRKAG